MPISWIEHKNKKMLFIDLNGASPQEMMRTIEEQKMVIDGLREPVLLLNDFRGTYATQEFMNKAKEYGKLQKDKINKIALLGIEGIKKILVKAFIMFSNNSNTKIFNSLEEAKDFLAE